MDRLHSSEEAGFKSVYEPQRDRLFSLEGTGLDATTLQGSLAKPMANTLAMGTLSMVNRYPIWPLRFPEGFTGAFPQVG